MGISVKQVSKSFGSPPTHVLQDISFEVSDGEFVSLSGRSGSGKSTLLYILSTLDSPSSGTIEIDGENVATMNVKSLHRFRNLKMGFVFQFHHLLPELTALENVLMPAAKTGQTLSRREKARELLSSFGLATKEARFPSQLSGGEQQRVAIARALIMEPRYLFADEPTGNLDTANGDIVMQLLARINKERGTTVIYVTHDKTFASFARRTIELVDGRQRPHARL